jgi:hypothetical protein
VRPLPVRDGYRLLELLRADAKGHGFDVTSRCTTNGVPAVAAGGRSKRRVDDQDVGVGQRVADAETVK